ncbi:AFG2-interacting ribosome maturation factor-like [Emydura macquarii macquarii]|uniref:AFG2-interacting ribosome maturation factor-like n=1 Tax=Emydura macquarii macquarii TaxID=1129001 RepID=UPI00352AD55C
MTLVTTASMCCSVQACRKVPFAHAPLGAFPELAEQLEYKQGCAAEILLADLGGKVPAFGKHSPEYIAPCFDRADLQKVRDAVSGYVGSVFQLYEQLADVLGFEVSVQRTAPNPSLAEMLEWLHDTERYYRHVYLESKLLLLQIRYENLPDMQTLPQSWERILEHDSRKMLPGIFIIALIHLGVSLMLLKGAGPGD